MSEESRPTTREVFYSLLAVIVCETVFLCGLVWMLAKQASPPVIEGCAVGKSPRIVAPAFDRNKSDTLKPRATP